MNDPTGYECDCAACGLRFAGEAEFDAHRIGRYGTPSRRCLTPAELREAHIEFLMVPREATAGPTAKANPCPHWQDCIAAHCPATGEGRHLRGEAICPLLLLAAKRLPIPAEVAGPVQAAMPALAARHSDIRHRLVRAAGQGSRAENLAAA